MAQRIHTHTYTCQWGMCMPVYCHNIIHVVGCLRISPLYKVGNFNLTKLWGLLCTVVHVDGQISKQVRLTCRHACMHAWVIVHNAVDHPRQGFAMFQ